MASEENDRKPGQGRPSGDAGQGAPEPETLPLLEEELSIGTEKAETGRVRVRVATHEHEESVDVPLTSQHVEVERIAIGQEVDSIPPRRQEGDTMILPVVEEVVLVSRKLVLKEEVRIKVVGSTEQYRERVFLHRQEAVVERAPSDQASAKQAPS